MDDDGTSFSPPSSDSPPVHSTKLKRLRKKSSSSSVSMEDPPPEPSSSLPVQLPTKESDPTPSAVGMDCGDAIAPDDGLDPLFGEQGRFTGCVAAGPNWGVEDEEMEDGSRKSGDSQKKRLVKKRLDLEWGDDDSGRKTKKKRKPNAVEGDDGFDGDWTPVENTNNKRKHEKERKARLEQLHVESQRLLRETRDASFKPAPCVQKPVSSVIEKIRLRKLEISKRLLTSNEPNLPDVENFSINSDNQNLDTLHAKPSTKEGAVSRDLGHDCDVPLHNATDIHLASQEGDQQKHDEDANYNSISDYQTSIPDAQGHALDLPAKEEMGSGVQPNSSENSVDLLNNTRSFSSASDDSSSDEEDYDKENTDPLKDNPSHMNLYKTSGLVKTFLDDEAEEEDDSDHDLMRFQENDEDCESEENELKDMIATSFREKPIDQKKRDELHQKWIEQQDAADTDNVLQRLKKREQHRETSIIQDDHLAEDHDDESDECSLDNVTSKSNSQQKIKRQKRSMIQLFVDKDEGYVSSDEEEIENQLSYQHYLKQAKNNTSNLDSSVDGDGNSREVFSLIKKLNIAPDPKRKTKIGTPSYEMLLMGGNSNSSSKSFLGRPSNNSLPFAIKKGASNYKSFIFGRDDSNSRNGISTSDTISKNVESRSTKTASAKFNYSQSKSGDSKNNSADNTDSEPSLFQFLQHSSLQSHKVNQKVDAHKSESRAAHQLTAFMQKKAPRKSI